MTVHEPSCIWVICHQCTHLHSDWSPTPYLNLLLPTPSNVENRPMMSPWHLKTRCMPTESGFHLQRVDDTVIAFGILWALTTYSCCTSLVLWPLKLCLYRRNGNIYERPDVVSILLYWFDTKWKSVAYTIWNLRCTKFDLVSLTLTMNFQSRLYKTTTAISDISFKDPDRDKQHQQL